MIYTKLFPDAADNRQFAQPPTLPIEKATQRMTSHPALNPLTNLLIAGISAVPARLSVNSFSVLRACAQAGACGHKTGPYWGSYWIYRSEGIRGFMKGIVMSGAKSFPLMAIQFSVYDALSKAIVPKIPNNKPSFLASSAIFICGGVAGVTAQALLHPCDVIKTRLILQDLSIAPVYTGTTNCVQQLLAKGGTMALYRGFLPSVVGSGVFGAYMFTLYDFFNRLPWNRNNQPLFHFGSYLDPVFAICIAGFISSPFDVIRRKMMAYEPFLPKNGRVDVVADTVMNTVINTYREAGFPGFFRGFVSTAAKSAQQLLVFYLCYSTMQKIAVGS